MLLQSASSSSGTASFFMRSYSSNVTDVDRLVQLLPGRAQVEFWLELPKQFLLISDATNRCRLKQQEAADAAPLNS